MEPSYVEAASCDQYVLVASSVFVPVELLPPQAVMEHTMAPIKNNASNLFFIVSSPLCFVPYKINRYSSVFVTPQSFY